MKTVREFLTERYTLNEGGEGGGGQDAGKMELIKIKLPEARAFADAQFKKNGMELDKEIPDFDKNFAKAQRLAGLGKTQRKDMPVINTEDVRVFQGRLKKGSIDITTPYAHSTKAENPFPEGLTGAQAKLWLEKGLRDGDKKDDIVNVSMKQVAVGDLKPIQKQIYFDKSISGTAKFGNAGTKKFLTKDSIFIASADKYIIDGHHRFLSGVLLDPSMKVSVLTIDLPIDKLLPLTLSYGDAIGNKRNQ